LDRSIDKHHRNDDQNLESGEDREAGNRESDDGNPGTKVSTAY
jgi:hypothetical protein